MTTGVTESDVPLPGGGVLHVYDTHPGDRPGDADRLAVLWHHGPPNVGAPPAPLLDAAERLGLRWVSYDRPGYGGSTPQPGRTLASAAGWAAAAADALGIDRFGLVGHSGGGSHALAAAALLGDRATGVVAVSALAPFDAGGLDWFDGMLASGVASLRAATAGRAAKLAFEESGVEYDPEFTPADLAALHGPWSWFDDVVGPAVAGGPGGLVDDDVAYVAPWGADPARVTAPTLVLHGGRDRIAPPAHAEWLARTCPAAELWLRPDDGHISVLGAGEDALEWLAAPSRRARPAPHG